MKKTPGQIIRQDDRGMLPKNKMQDKLISRLKVYAGNEHPHVSQQPENLEV